MTGKQRGVTQSPPHLNLTLLCHWDVTRESLTKVVHSSITFLSSAVLVHMFHFLLNEHKKIKGGGSLHMAVLVKNYINLLPHVVPILE